MAAIVSNLRYGTSKVMRLAARCRGWRSVMGGFDIESLTNFSRATYMCENCSAIFKYDDLPWHVNKCPVCEIEYVPTGDYQDMKNYLAETGHEIKIDGVLAHCQKLGHLAKNLKGFQSKKRPIPRYAPLEVLLSSILQAQSFIHFSTFNIAEFFIGIFALASRRINVRGIVSGAELRKLELYERAKGVDEMFEIAFFHKDSGFEDIPHQKIVIIDGLVAFKGSANLQDLAWQKAADKMEMVEMVTNLDEVIKLNNIYFSPFWAGHKAESSLPPNGSILMENEIAF